MPCLPLANTVATLVPYEQFGGEWRLGGAKRRQLHGHHFCRLPHAADVQEELLTRL